MMNRFCYWPVLFAVLVIGGVVGPAAAQQTINEARNEPLGTSVTVEGTVTRAYGAYVRLQDASGPTGASAIVIRQTSGTNSEAFQGDISDGTIQPGTTLEVTGATSAFYGIIQINDDNLDSYTVQGQGDPPSPQSVSLTDLKQNGEDYESELIRVDGLRFASASGTFQNRTTYTVEDEEGTSVEFRVQSSSETALGGTQIPGSVFAFEGVLGQFHGGDAAANEPNEGYQLIPVRERDLQSSRSFRFNRLFSIAGEGDEAVSVDVQAFDTGGEDVSVTAQVSAASTAENGTDVTGFQSPTTLTFTGTDPGPKTLTFEPVDDGEQEGVERLEVTLSSSDGAIASPSTFTLWVLDNPTAQAPVVAGDSGGVLVDSLGTRYGNPPTLGYDRARDLLYGRIYNESGTVESIYSGLQVSVDPDGGDPSGQAFDQGVNTEHLWPRSKGAGEEPALSNLYILAPAWSEANGYRCNYPYAEIDDAEAERWIKDRDVQPDPPPTGERDAYTESIGNTCGNPSENGRIEPRHSVKGDVARAVFYFVMAYPGRADVQFFEDQRQTLLDWHEQDPVDATEMRRMLLAASHQANRPNPFVLDSTLANRAYGQGRVQPNKVTIQEARSLGSDRTVTVEGVVTQVEREGVYLQDDTGALFVFESEGEFGRALGQSIQRGARLEVTGTLGYFAGLLELTDVPDGGFSVLSQGNALPDAPTLSLGDIASNGETYESEVVRAENVAIEAGGDDTFQAGDDGGNYTLRQGPDSLTLHIPSNSELAGTSIPRRATVQGPLGQFNGGSVGDEGPDEGYQIVASDASDLTVLLPRQTSIDVTRSFGDPSTGDSYRLVALPGQVDRSLAETVSGENGIGWQAYWDNGSDQDFLVKFDGSDQFTFEPGRGFWLLGTSDWSVEATISSVRAEGGAATVPLHDGWNVISNPLPSDVAWSAVDGANGGSLQALWRWAGGQFQQTDTFTSATTGEAFYFLNDQGLDQLSVPLAPSSSSATGKAAGAERAVAVVAERNEATSARIRVAEHAEGSDGKDDRDLAAPPSRFADLSLRLQAPFAEEAGPRQTRLARDVRSTGTPGQTYTLLLRADTTGPVTLRAASLPQSSRTTAVLLDPTTGEPHDLRDDGPMAVSAGPEPTRVQLLVGTRAYVEGKAAARVPETLTVEPPAPNPFRERTTLRYALPEAQHVRIEVYDLLGRRVHTLVDGQQEAGPHRATWTGRAGSQRELASGTYLVRLSAGGEQHVEKIVLVR